MILGKIKYKEIKEELSFKKESFSFAIANSAKPSLVEHNLIWSRVNRRVAITINNIK